ncbi:aspartic proteinase CDR1-like [Vigna unguiculata]|uniref:Aspartyl protease family protein n=1 Tax=Vigna unguiculata TaxID=3917 RepID=A0A4D6LTE8_VIGUN|nr:aspartic proteinase CDR1-like [Vigna unguiculata]QCD91771.1 aspartyl protease family protein [Vigna unguiculata]
MASYYLTICVLFLLPLHFSLIHGNTEEGFTINLIRKTSLQPSFPQGFSAMSTIPQSPVSAYLGEYLMELSIGTPPFKIYAIADTGSDLMWTQCVPCNDCYKQINPMFDPTKSSSYTNVPCSSNLCHLLDTGVCSPQKECNYTYAYGDGSMTQGVLAQETVTFTSTTGASVPLKGIVFGCGHNDSKNGFNDHEMGLIGLGGGPASLISQMGSSFGGKMFSQCLVPFHTDERVSSKMSFGRGSKVSGSGVVSTPLVTKEDKTPYFVTLLGISVGNKYLPYSGGSSQNVAKGNVFLDSGTPPTILPTEFYDRVVAEVKNQVPMKPVVDDPSLGTQLCYRTKNNLGGPVLTAHFEGADVKLEPIQTFIPPKDGVFCLGFTNTSSDVGIYGNFVQSNYLIGFDLEAKMVSFKARDCTKNT